MKLETQDEAAGAKVFYATTATDSTSTRWTFPKKTRSGMGFSAEQYVFYHKMAILC